MLIDLDKSFSCGQRSHLLFWIVLMGPACCFRSPLQIAVITKTEVDPSEMAFERNFFVKEQIQIQQQNCFFVSNSLFPSHCCFRVTVSMLVCYLSTAHKEFDCEDGRKILNLHDPQSYNGTSISSVNRKRAVVTQSYPFILIHSFHNLFLLPYINNLLLNI